MKIFLEFEIAGKQEDLLLIPDSYLEQLTSIYIIELQNLLKRDIGIDVEVNLSDISELRNDIEKNEDGE